MQVNIENVIRTINTEGDGKNEVCRQVTRYWSMEGQLIVEIDQTQNKSQINIDATKSIKLNINEIKYVINSCEDFFQQHPASITMDNFTTLINKLKK